MLLVVVDQPGIGRGRQHEVDRLRGIEHPGIAVEHQRRRLSPKHTEVVDALGGVADVPAEELRRLADGPARLPVLVAEVLGRDGLPGKIEIVVSRAPGGARSPRKDDAPEPGIGRTWHACAEGEQLANRARRKPPVQVRRGVPRHGLALRLPELNDVREQSLRVVHRRLRFGEHAVERRHVTARSPHAERVGFDERRPRAGKRIPDEVAGRAIAPQEDFRELWHELPEIRMQPVHVLRPLALGKVGFRPRELEIDLTVEGGLRAHGYRVRRRCHRTFARYDPRPWQRSPPMR